MKDLYSFLFLIFYVVFAANAQGIPYGSKVTLQGKIVDTKTQEPVSFANIGFIGKGIGTVSDADGNYSLEFAPTTLDKIDSLQFSVIGYKTRIFSKNEALLAVGKQLNTNLTREPYSLNEVVIGESNRRKSTIGDLDYDERIVGYWKDIEGLGGEILTKIKVRRKNTKLHNLKFNVLENESDSLLVRVNVYSTDRGLVGQNLLKKSIKYTINTKKGLVTIPLEEYEIYVHHNIIVGIELLKVYGRQIGFSLSGSRSKGVSYVRYRSQDKYKHVDDTSMAFQLDISIPDNRGNSIDKRDQVDHITLYWDVSASKENRDIEKELFIVEELLEETREAQVDVIKYSFEASEPQTFYLHNGRTKDILSYLKESNYHSIGHIENLPRPESRENALAIIVSAGQTMISDINPDFPVPVFMVTTNTDVNIEELEKLVVYSDGDLLDGSKETIKELRKRFTHYIDETPVNQKPLPVASGTIKVKQDDSLVGLQGAIVTVRGSFKNTTTDNTGNYSINATPEDVLSIHFPGMKDKEIKVDSKINNATELEPIFEMLDQVVINGQNKDKRLVVTPTGEKDENTVGFKNNTIDASEIYARYTTLGDILRKFSNIEVRYDPFSRQEVYIFPRTFYSSILTPQPPIVVIDGSIYRQDGITQLPQIDTQNIKSINASSSIIGTTQYGSIAAGGVIAIKTKAGNPSPSAKKDKASALVQGNNYDQIEIPSLESIEISDVKRRLAQGSSLSASKEKYFNILKVRTNVGMSFYMEAFDFFKDKDAEFAKEVITSMIAKAPYNKQALRAVGYALEELETYDLASDLYKHILKIAPRDIQSYRDLAKSHLDNNNYKNAFEGYKTILANDIEGLDFKPLQETAENELKRLLGFHKSKVSYSDLPNELLVGEFKKDQRLVFEWNDPSVQFELQFVSPDSKFFTWDHTIYKNQKKVVENIRNGHMIQEFELDNLSIGEWLINLSYLSDNSSVKESSFIKYTLYTDYGAPDETKKVKVIPLNQIHQKTTIDRIIIKKQSIYEN